jgi:AbrB family looped-hinge helix DNA binding protein
MNTKLNLDKAGRIVLPKPIRDELQLEPGDELEISLSEEEITLRPARRKAALKKKQGVWVFRAGESLSQKTVEATIDRIRPERTSKNPGKNQ